MPSARAVCSLMTNSNLVACMDCSRLNSPNPQGHDYWGIFQELMSQRDVGEERETTFMPLLVFLSVCSYWRTVNVEMTRSTLQFLDTEEGSKASHAGALGFWAT
jgi:hypothetical protein